MWLKSTTTKTYSVEGRIIPASTSKDYLSVDEKFYQTNIIGNVVLNSLINNGAIFVTDKEPVTGQDVVLNKNAELRRENDAMASELSELRRQLAAAQAEKEELRKEALEEIGKLKAQAAKKGRAKDEE